MSIHNVSEKQGIEYVDYDSLKKSREKSQETERAGTITELRGRLAEDETPKMFSAEKKTSSEVAFYVSEDVQGIESELHGLEILIRRMDRLLYLIEKIYEKM